MEKTIKGFSKDEIFELYQFINIYESDVAKCGSNVIGKKYPDFSIKEWKKVSKNLKHFTVNNQEGFNCPVPPYTLIDGNKRIVRKKVITHIRNAFVHQSLEKDGLHSCIFLTDIYNKTDKKRYIRKGDISAKYFFDTKIFWNIIRIFTKPDFTK